MKNVPRVAIFIGSSFDSNALCWPRNGFHIGILTMFSFVKYKLRTEKNESQFTTYINRQIQRNGGTKFPHNKNLSNYQKGVEEFHLTTI